MYCPRRCNATNHPLFSEPNTSPTNSLVGTVDSVASPPVYSMRDGELTVSSHMEDFFACMRSRQLPRCHVGRAFEETVTILMSVESFRRERKVRWDPVKETIV